MLQLQVVESASRRETVSADAVAALGVCLRTLRSEFRVLAPYEHIGRADRTKNTSVADAARLALLLNRHALTGAGIDVTIDGDDFSARSRPAALVQILDNLVHNATHWVSDRDRTDRRIAIILQPANRAVLVADSGPGLHPEMVDHAFEAFTTMKVDGTGLGLFISSQLADSLGCTLRLATEDERPADYPGAAFLVQFPSQPASEGASS
jgi:C4-dicarboxylate-specific signal transduction histidine kinase